VTFWSPLITVSFVPAGTPVLEESGNPQALGCGPQSARLRSAGVPVPVPVPVACDAEAEAEADGDFDGDLDGDGEADAALDDAAAEAAGPVVDGAGWTRSTEGPLYATPTSVAPPTTARERRVISTAFRLKRRFFLNS
jgi:hypothetical protein